MQPHLIIDLVKARRSATNIGRLGGHYYRAEASKIYVAHQDRTPVEAPLAHVLDAVPHLGDDHGIIKVRGQTPKHLQSEDPQQIQFPTYFCKLCSASVVPTRDVPILKPHATERDSQGNPKLVKVGEATKIKVRTPKAIQELQSIHPNAVAGKLCPICYEKSLTLWVSA